MGFYENDRIKRKNAIYNFPDTETNVKARKLINLLKNKVQETELSVKEMLESDLQTFTLAGYEEDILVTATALKILEIQ